ncbi:MAG: co-chaperone GroES [Actinomycetota bacterium]
MPRATDTKDGATSSKTKTTAAKPRKPRNATASADPALRLTGDRLVVRVPGNGERKSAGGLLIPATAMPAPKRLSWGDVTLIGPDVRVAKQGDRVLFLPSAGLEVELEGEDLVLLRERDVQAVAETPAASTAKDRAPGQYL